MPGAEAETFEAVVTVHKLHAEMAALGFQAASTTGCRLSRTALEALSSLGRSRPRAGTSSYGYDPLGALTALDHNLPGTPSDVSWSYAHNRAGQMTSVTRNNDAYAWTGHYGVNRPYVANGLNQYTQVGPSTYTYDGNGNVLSDGGTNFGYDAESRLISLSGARNATLDYDPLGRLWRVSSGGSATSFLYDGNDLAAEYNAAGAMTARYIHAPGIDTPLARYDGASTTAPQFMISDERGSIVALSDASGGVVRIAYDEYGMPQGPAGPNTLAGRFGYTGQLWLPEIGLYYFKARVYSPTLGRFLQTDPIGFEGGMNIYAYVGNDPVDLVDPMGRGSQYPDTAVTGKRDPNEYEVCSQFACSWMHHMLSGINRNRPLRFIYGGGLRYIREVIGG
jgi:RHS repeat-associated protein